MNLSNKFYLLLCIGLLAWILADIQEVQRYEKKIQKISNFFETQRVQQRIQNEHLITALNNQILLKHPDVQSQYMRYYLPLDMTYSDSLDRCLIDESYVTTPTSRSGSKSNTSFHDGIPIYNSRLNPIFKNLGKERKLNILLNQLYQVVSPFYCDFLTGPSLVYNNFTKEFYFGEFMDWASYSARSYVTINEHDFHPFGQRPPFLIPAADSLKISLNILAPAHHDSGLDTFCIPFTFCREQGHRWEIITQP